MGTIKDFTYDRTKVTADIAHIGVGNFHRAHMQYYLNLLLEHPGQQAWGVCGIGILPSDGELIRALASQDSIYTLTCCDGRGNDRTYRIGSLVELLWGAEDPGKVVAKFADPAIKVISLTITEGGYNIDRATGEFIMDNRDIRHDLSHGAGFRTVFAYIAAGLRRRMELSGGPVTILSCDNLRHNGDVCRHAFLSFIRAKDNRLAAWVTENVTFPNSMVDRITPAVSEKDRVRLNEISGVNDRVPVYCENFSQWIIEDKFAGVRPPLELVGARFTDDVIPYENMKLSLLNASHSMLAYPAFLAGYRRVDQAIKDGRFACYLYDYMKRDVLPNTDIPTGTDPEEYCRVVIERFGNAAVGDRLSRICYDGASKIPGFIVPVVTEMLKKGSDISRIAFMVASYRKYLRGGFDDNGEAYRIDEPWLSEKDRSLISSSDPVDFLGISPLAGAGIVDNENFTKVYIQMARNMESAGTLPTLETIL